MCFRTNRKRSPDPVAKTMIIALLQEIPVIETFQLSSSSTTTILSDPALNFQTSRIVHIEIESSGISIRILAQTRAGLLPIFNLFEGK